MHYLLRSPIAPSIQAALSNGPLHVPAHFDAEVYGAIRRELLLRHIDLATAVRTLYEMRTLLVQRHLLPNHLMDALALRDNIGSHDVFYVLLARRLGATFVTCDGPLSRAASPYCDVRHIAA